MTMKHKMLHPSPATKTITVAEPKEQVYGVDVSNLQENIEFSEEDGNKIKVKGNSKYVESYPGFSEKAKGNFLAIEIEEAKNGDTVSFELSEAQEKGQGTLNSEDSLLVCNIHSNTQTITLKNGNTTKVLDLTGLTLSPAE